MSEAKVCRQKRTRNLPLRVFEHFDRSDPEITLFFDYEKI